LNVLNDHGTHNEGEGARLRRFWPVGFRLVPSTPPFWVGGGLQDDDEELEVDPAEDGARPCFGTDTLLPDES